MNSTIVTLYRHDITTAPRMAETGIRWRAIPFGSSTRDIQGESEESKFVLVLSDGVEVGRNGYDELLAFLPGHTDGLPLDELIVSQQHRPVIADARYGTIRERAEGEASSTADSLAS